MPLEHLLTRPKPISSRVCAEEEHHFRAIPNHSPKRVEHMICPVWGLLHMDI